MKAGLITEPPMRRDYGDTSSQSQNRLSCVSTVSKGVLFDTEALEEEYAQSASCQDLTYQWILLQQTFLGQMGITVMERSA